MPIKIPAKKAIIIKKEYKFRRRDISDSLDAQVEASQAFREFRAMDGILSPYFQGSASYLVADRREREKVPPPYNLDNAVRYCHIGLKTESHKAVADWVFFHSIKNPGRLSSAWLYMELTTSSVPFFEDVAKALESVSELHFPEGMNYHGGISLVKGGQVRDLGKFF